MARAAAPLLVVLAAAAGSAAEEPPWTAKVPDFRSAWPEPLAPGTEGPDFTLEDAATGKAVRLSKAREGRKATLLLFLDDNCSTCRKRAADLAGTLRRVGERKDAAALAIFVRNLSGGGARAAREFAEKAKFPAVPVLFDGKDNRAGVTLAYRVPVSPCAVVLDAAGRIAYFGLALANEGSDLVPGIVAAVAAGTPLDGPSVRPPYG